jgi:glutamate dehydrogenase/leucine dehydrogenase
VAASLARELEGRIELVSEDRWSSIPSVSIFSPNAASASLTRENLPVLKGLGVRAIVGGENNPRDRGVDADEVHRRYGILTFADFLLNGGGAWIVGAEMAERPVENVHEWIAKYQVPTVLKTIELAKDSGRAPESVFLDFIGRKVKELLA